MTAAISAMSWGVSDNVAASNQPSTWRAFRAPTIAAVTPGQASVHATATAATVVRYRSAIPRMASATNRLRVSASPVKLALRDRQSLAGNAAALATLNDPLSSPACIGL